MALRHGTLLEEGVIAAVIHCDLVLRLVELHHGGDAAGEELTVVGHQDGSSAETEHEFLEPRQPVQVEVVGRFIEQDHVEAAQQQGCERHPGQLAAGECSGRCCRVDGIGHIGEDRQHALIEVGGAGGHPVIEGRRVSVIRPRCSGAERLRRSLQGGSRRRRPCAAPKVRRHRFATVPLVFLGEPADEGVGRRRAHRTSQWRVHSREQLEQRRLAGTIGADHADHIARRNSEIEVGEEGPVSVAAGQCLGHEGCSHSSILGRGHATGVQAGGTRRSDGRTGRRKSGHCEACCGSCSQPNGGQLLEQAKRAKCPHHRAG